MAVLLFNPLPTTLRHYQDELQETLQRIGVASEVASPRPATDSPAPHPARALAHLRAVRGRTAGARPIVLWPAFGWLEPLLWWRTAGCQLIVHDPAPIRKQYGYGSLARAIGRTSLDQGGMELVCHTSAARAEIEREVAPARSPTVCLHPILSSRPEAGSAAEVPASEPVALVAGQYKPSRDLELLSRLGPALRGAGLRPRVVGRGWPQVAGWEVEDAFLSESEFDLELRRASVLLVPYRQYWQSGVAVRALENGTEVVGSRTEFLATLLGADHPGLIDGDSHAGAWLAAIEATVDGSSGLDGRRRVYQNATDESWASLFERFI
jgi:hypothetical protein